MIKKTYYQKNFSSKKLKKNYNSFAYTTIIKHKKFINNKIAAQFFTENGPLAFLPISEFETSIVYSVKNSKKINFEKTIIKYNKNYKITKINPIQRFELESSNLRSYRYNNILAFGDLLHKVHPLAGQGFNMNIRDIKILTDLIKFNLNHGLELNSSICNNFEKKTRHKNYLFSNGIDFIYEFFNFENKINNKVLSKSIQFLGKNKHLNNFFTHFADKGIKI